MSDLMQRVLWISLGGAAGANLRYWFGSWVQSRHALSFPFGTFLVNVSGSFVLGLFMALAAERFELLPNSSVRLAFAVGFVGAYTTFSTFEYETFALLESGEVMTALLNVTASVAVGFAAVWGGVAVGRMF